MPLIKYGQKGYSGNSMSNRAVSAYSNGEMPLSKWTKSKILAGVSAYFVGKTGKMLVEKLKKMTLRELAEKFLTKTSWHHTSKFANPTNFYSVDKNKAIDIVLRTDKKRKQYNHTLKEIQDTMRSIEYSKERIKEQKNSLYILENKIKQIVDDIKNIEKQSPVSLKILRMLKSEYQRPTARYSEFLEKIKNRHGIDESKLMNLRSRLRSSEKDLSIYNEGLKVSTEELKKEYSNLRELLKKKKLLGIKAISYEETL